MQMSWKATFLGMSKLLFELSEGVLERDFSWDVQATFRVICLCRCVGKLFFLGCPTN